MNNDIIVDIENVGSVVLKEGTSIEEIINKQNLENEIIAASINGEVVELDYKLYEDTKIKLIDLKNINGARIYRSGLKFLYITAVKELFGSGTNVELKHSLDKGIYTKINIDVNEKITTLKISKNMKKQVYMNKHQMK